MKKKTTSQQQQKLLTKQFSHVQHFQYKKHKLTLNNSKQKPQKSDHMQILCYHIFASIFIIFALAL